MTFEDLQRELASEMTTIKSKKPFFRFLEFLGDRLLCVGVCLVDILLFFWQLPQNIFGFVFLVFLMVNKYVKVIDFIKPNVLTVRHPYRFGCSLGDFFFVRSSASLNLINHEYGHHIQSLIFGPFYLLFVALPSLVRYIWQKVFKKSEQWYLSGWPEKQADILGHVKRNF